MAGPFRTLAGVAAVVALVASASHAQAPATTLADALRARIDAALTSAPRNYDRLLSPQQAGVRVLSVDVSNAAGVETIAIDLSQRALTYDPSGNIEPLLDRIIEATASSVGTQRAVRYQFTVEGLAIDRFLPRAEPRFATRTPSLGEGGTILVSPGHGWYFEEVLGYWHFQRPRVRGIVEDLVNWDIARYLRDELLLSSVNAQMLRYSERDEQAGPSGNPRWEEAAKYFIQTLGAPPDVWNFGADDYARDINTRPFYANWIDATALVSVHNNGGQETGTETWYDETNGFQDESRRLAEIVQRHVVSAIRERYNGGWIDRGLRSCDGCKGENRLALRPAVIVEIAYMDTITPDNDALHDDEFKHIVAQAIRDAVVEWGSAR